MILPDGRVESCGNFHGAPLGFACDFLAIAAAEVGAIAERRTDRLLDATRSHGLPPFLTTDAGVNSGMMIAQYTQAGMVAENRRLAAPASVDSLPTSRDAGGPRLDGVGRGAQAAPVGREPGADPGRRAHLRGARPRPARAAATGAARRPRRSPRCGRTCPARGRTGSWRPSSPRPRQLVGGGELLRATEAVAGALE